jgi:hypothetical protein
MIKEDRLKESALDDSAVIYQKRDKQSEKEKLKSMNGKQKLEYFNHYYRNKLIVGIAIVAFLIYMTYTMLTPRPVTELFVAVINNAISSTNVDTLKTEFGQILGVEPDSQGLIIDNTFYTSSSGETSELTLANEQKLGVYIFSGEIDIIVASESDFENYAYYGNFIKLSDVLPSDLITTLAPKFVYAELEDTKTKSAYGISLKDVTVYDNSNQRVENPVLGIVANSKQKENSVEFIKYLFGLK